MSRFPELYQGNVKTQMCGKTTQTHKTGFDVLHNS